MWLTLALSPATSRASVPDLVPRPSLQAVHVVKGDVVPFDGMLLTPELAVSLGQKAERCDEIRQLGIRSANEICTLRARAAAEVRSIETDRHRAEIIRLERALDDLAVAEAEARGRAEEAETSRWRWAGMSLAGGVAVGMLAAAGAGAAAVWVAAQLADVAIARSLD